MSHRGRGCLEIKPNSNPFLQPVYGDYGIKPHEHIDWKVEGKTPHINAVVHKVEGNFAFLYSRESDKIGGRLPKPQKEQPRVLTKTEFLKKKREDLEEAMQTSDFQLEEPAPVVLLKQTAEEMVKLYRHAPVEEDPRFTTTNVSSSTYRCPKL